MIWSFWERPLPGPAKLLAAITSCKRPATLEPASGGCSRLRCESVSTAPRRISCRPGRAIHFHTHESQALARNQRPRGAHSGAGALHRRPAERQAGCRQSFQFLRASASPAIGRGCRNVCQSELRALATEGEEQP